MAKEVQQSDAALNPDSELGMNDESKSVRLSKRVFFTGGALFAAVMAIVAWGVISSTSNTSAQTQKQEEAAPTADDLARKGQQRELAGSIDERMAASLRRAEAAEQQRLRAQAEAEEAARRAALKQQAGRQQEQSGQPNQGVPTNNTGASTQPQRKPTQQEQQMQQEQQRLRQMRMQRFEQALSARINAQVNSDALASADTPQGRDERAAQLERRQAAYQQRLREIRSNSGTQVLAGGGQSPAATSAAGSGAPAVRAGTVNDPYASMASAGWDLGAALEAPLDRPFLVRAGTVIPATLISGINSDLPGQIIGQVSQNVYDTATGKYLLVPQGTRLIGTYGTQTAYGQERVLVAWQRLVYPDGKTLDLGGMPGTDTAGYSGFRDLVDNHWWKMISSAFLMSGIVATVSVATDDDDNDSSDDDDSTSMNDELMRAMATQFGNVIAQVIQRNLNISPTIQIRPGYKFNVMTTRDMNFAGPYQEFDYL